MTALIIILGVLVLLALMPVGVRALFDGALTVYLTLFGVSFRIYPQPKRTKKKPKKTKKDSKNTQKSPKKTAQKASLLHCLIF